MLLEGRADQPPRFVVQRHTASRLHFDFRLEIEGQLVTWAVSNGLSLDPGERRLATRTGIHPLQYLDFEGRVSAGRYGGGTVVVWDTGVVRNLSNLPLGAALRRGELRVWLAGKRLAGGYALTQIRTRGGDHNWVLEKLDDQEPRLGLGRGELVAATPRRAQS